MVASGPQHMVMPHVCWKIIWTASTIPTYSEFAGSPSSWTGILMSTKLQNFHCLYACVYILTCAAFRVQGAVVFASSLRSQEKLKNVAQEMAGMRFCSRPSSLQRVRYVCDSVIKPMLWFQYGEEFSTSALFLSFFWVNSALQLVQVICVNLRFPCFDLFSSFFNYRGFVAAPTESMW